MRRRAVGEPRGRRENFCIEFYRYSRQAAVAVPENRFLDKSRRRRHRPDVTSDAGETRPGRRKSVTRAGGVGWLAPASQPISNAARDFHLSLFKSLVCSAINSEIAIQFRPIWTARTNCSRSVTDWQLTSELSASEVCPLVREIFKYNN